MFSILPFDCSIEFATIFCCNCWMYRVIEKLCQAKNGWRELLFEFYIARKITRGRLSRAICDALARKFALERIFRSLDYAAFYQPLRDHQKNSLKAVVPCMRHHSRTQTFPQDGQRAEHCAINKNEQHALLALVSVRKTEDRSRDQHAQPHIA